MPQLQLHMLRVAGVALIICDNFKKEINKDPVITASLVHDMGNIIKFNLRLFPENLKPQGLKYWEKVKKEFTKKFGDDEHFATEEICREIGIEETTFKIIKGYGFSKGENTFHSNDFSLKIATYSDHRISPFGVTKLIEKINGSLERKYLNKTSSPQIMERVAKIKDCWKKIEQQIFNHTKISPEDITDGEVTRLIPILREYDIQTS
ncbi:HD domain-containing protein [Candidatus Woesebacteria bacterium]|nr:HD domain-containing protein [Candidatus Woesebacteria bacterium]